MSDDRIPPEDKSSLLARFAYALFALGMLLIFLAPIGLVHWFGGEKPLGRLEYSDWGDFLSGILGPASIFVLSASFLLQREELQLQRNELRETRKTLEAQQLEMRRSAEEAGRQSKILETQSIIVDWQETKNNLKIDMMIVRFYLQANAMNVMMNINSPEQAFFSEIEIIRFVDNDATYRAYWLENPDKINLAIRHIDIYKYKIDSFLDRLPPNPPIPKRVFIEAAEYRLMSMFEQIRERLVKINLNRERE